VYQLLIFYTWVVTLHMNVVPILQVLIDEFYVYATVIQFNVNSSPTYLSTEALYAVNK